VNFLSLKILAVASRDVAIEELYSAVKLILGDVCTIQTILTQDVKDDSGADLFVCGITQFDQLAQVVPREKIILFELRFTSQFFIQVARIPAGEDVYILNTNMMLIKRLIQNFSNLGIREINFLPIATEAMCENEITERLQKAKYLIGIEDFLEMMVNPNMQYAKYINKDIKVIGGKRVASMESACRLIQWVAEALNKVAAKKVAVVTNQLNSSLTIAQDQNLIATVSNFDEIMMESKDSLLKMREAIVNSFANQISTNISIVDNVVTGSGESKIHNDQASELTQNLDQVKGLSDSLSNIANKLGGIK
jgi:hypothetical protein